VIKPRNRQDPQRRRDQIIEQAIDVLGERGYFGFTIKDLATRCDLTNPGLLHYFPSKEHVLLGVLDALEKREIVLIKPLADLALAAGTAPGGKAAVIKVLRATVLRSCSQPRLMRLFVELQSEALNPDHPAQAWWQHRLTATSAFFVDLLRPFVPDPDGRARLLLAMSDGLSLQWLHADQSFDLPTEWEKALAMILPEFRRVLVAKAPPIISK
jgi:AcrR family transcriptional regulator